MTSHPSPKGSPRMKIAALSLTAATTEQTIREAPTDAGYLCPPFLISFLNVFKVW